MFHASFGNLRVPLNHHKSTLRSLKKSLPAIDRYTKGQKEMGFE